MSTSSLSQFLTAIAAAAAASCYCFPMPDDVDTFPRYKTDCSLLRLAPPSPLPWVLPSSLVLAVLSGIELKVCLEGKFLSNVLNRCLVWFDSFTNREFSFFAGLYCLVWDFHWLGVMFRLTRTSLRWCSSPESCQVGALWILLLVSFEKSTSFTPFGFSENLIC